MASNKNSATGLTTGFADLDRVTCGWQPGEEIVIAARPAVGKTAFTLHLVPVSYTHLTLPTILLV